MSDTRGYSPSATMIPRLVLRSSKAAWSDRNACAGGGGGVVEFLVDMVTTVPGGVSDDEVVEMRRREAVRAAELVAQGNLLRLWRPPVAPGNWRTWGLFSADDADQ